MQWSSFIVKCLRKTIKPVQLNLVRFLSLVKKLKKTHQLRHLEGEENYQVHLRAG